MARRRLTAIAGALGLLAWLATSGVTAQAATPPGPDLTYRALLAYSSLNQNTCYANSGTADNTIAGTCTITQPASDRGNIAVCVQSSYGAAPTQTCSISQTNGTHNNYALVIQRFQQSQGPNQDANQRASIQQTTTGSGSNFAGAFQTIIQSVGQEDDPIQTNTQYVAAIAPNGPGGLEQLSASGSNFAAVGQFSAQSASGGTIQIQTADQLAGHSGFGLNDGIDQTAPAGSNAASLSHIQKQQLNDSASQAQTAKQDGDITQNGSPGKNLASGNQFQDQQERGPLGGVQHQTGDPKCCSVQDGGSFRVTQATNQLEILGGVLNPFPNQKETLIGNCDSSPNGSCQVHQSATRQNGAPTTNDCPPPGSPSRSTCLGASIVCGSEGTGCFTTPGSSGGLAPVALRLARPAAARSARLSVA